MEKENLLLKVGTAIGGLLVIGMGVGIGIYSYKNKKKNNTLDRQEKEEKNESEVKETEAMINERILGSIKAEVRGRKSVKEILKVIVPRILYETKPKNRGELKSRVIGILVSTVPVNKLGDVPRNIEELEALIKEVGLEKVYEVYLEELYKKK